MRKRIARFLAASLSLTAFFALVGCTQKDSEPIDKVLLISIDGLRADAVANTEFGKYLLENSAYSLETTTVSPSITLPCHISMFYGVTPEEHGITDNGAIPSETMKNGITETLTKNGKASALFYDWEPIKYVAKTSPSVSSTYLDSTVHGFDKTVKMTGDACVRHIQETPTDFTFLYLAFPDEYGHNYGWLSEEYYHALNESFAVVKEVLTTLQGKDYTVILTADHGGHERSHGSTMYEDMTIPLFIIGENYTPGTNLGARSILDVAPTVVSLLNVDVPDHWTGTAIK